MASIDIGIVRVLIIHGAVGGEGVCLGRQGRRDGFRRGVAVELVNQNCSAYWRGVLYVQCNGGFTVMR